MDHLFFSWLATQSYSVEVAIGTIFVVIIAPAVLAGMASLATWAERPIVELLRMSGLLNPWSAERRTCGGCIQLAIWPCGQVSQFGINLVMA